MMKDIECYNKEELKVIIEDNAKCLNIDGVDELDYFNEVFGCFMDTVKKHDLDITTKKGYLMSIALLRSKFIAIHRTLRSLEMASKEELLSYARNCALTHYLRV